MPVVDSPQYYRYKYDVSFLKSLSLCPDWLKPLVHQLFLSRLPKAITGSHARSWPAMLGFLQRGWPWDCPQLT